MLAVTKDYSYLNAEVITVSENDIKSDIDVNEILESIDSSYGSKIKTDNI